MAGIKISSLPAVTLAQLTDYYPVVQGGITSRETVQQLVNLINSSSVLTGFVPVAGGTMTGPLILSGDAVAPLGAVTLQQLNTVAGGFTVILAALVATTSNLIAVYSNGAAGVGATLTNSGVQVALSVDGVVTVVGDRVLVKNQTSTFENGVFEVTDVGTGATNWIITRVADYDTAAEIQPGTLISINAGTVNATTSWLETATVVTVGTDPVLFSQFTFSPGSFLMKANNLSDVASISTSLVNLGFGIPTGTYPGNVVMQGSPSIITPSITARLNDVNGNTWINQISVAGAVNYLAIGNASAGAPVIGLIAQGANPQVFMQFSSKGGGAFLFTDTASSAIIRMYNAASTHFIGLSVPALQSTDLVYNLPGTDNAGFMISDGASNLSLTGTPSSIASLITINGLGPVTSNVFTQLKIGKMVFIRFVISGTSNSVSFSVTNLPVSAVSIQYQTILVTNNGTNAIGLCTLAGTTLTFYLNLGNPALWTASGIKSAYGGFWYEAS